MTHAICVSLVTSPPPSCASLMTRPCGSAFGATSRRRRSSQASRAAARSGRTDARRCYSCSAVAKTFVRARARPHSSACAAPARKRTRSLPCGRRCPALVRCRFPNCPTFLQIINFQFPTFHYWRRAKRAPQANRRDWSQHSNPKPGQVPAPSPPNTYDSKTPRVQTYAAARERTVLSTRTSRAGTVRSSRTHSSRTSTQTRCRRSRPRLTARCKRCCLMAG
mmetsp:Transcript_16242/g.42052  ORF Transcript_16242/g.42052 Transcript_16242/m.42052 type:complete len:222 (+) Transcript_16242:1319-1984(+)